MANEKFYSMLGLAARAGKIVKGAAACDAGIKNGKVKLLVVDGGASEGTKKSFSDACGYYRVEIIIVEELGELGRNLGKQGIKIAGIADSSFAKSIAEKYCGHSGGETFEQN